MNHSFQLDHYDEDSNRSSSSSDQSDLDSVTKATENPACSRLLSETDTLVEEARAFLQSDYRDNYSDKEFVRFCFEFEFCPICEFSSI
jgi:hypothetical protein